MLREMENAVLIHSLSEDPKVKNELLAISSPHGKFSPWQKSQSKKESLIGNLLLNNFLKLNHRRLIRMIQIHIKCNGFAVGHSYRNYIIYLFFFYKLTVILMKSKLKLLIFNNKSHLLITGITNLKVNKKI